MKILVDADACPVVKIIENVARKYKLDVLLLCDTNHFINSDYCEVKIIGAGADAVVLSKGGYCIHQSGKIFSDDNIGGLLMDRHLAKKARMSSNKNHLKGPKKRTIEDDKRFEESFEKLIISLI